VDLSERCIEKCRDRFAHESHISYFVNDGKSLGMVDNASVDFIFSFDSLVHAEDAVLRAYMAEFAKILRPDGVAFIHHSNLGEYKGLVKALTRLAKIPKLVGGLNRLGLVDNVIINWRDRNMTAEKLAMFAEEHGLQCVSQELVTWQTRTATIDCFSTVVRKGSRWSRQNRVLRNPGFMREAESLRKISSVYDYRNGGNKTEQT
jgi:SAM-dependent methyltransferase